MKTHQSSAVTRRTGGPGGFCRRLALASCGLVWASSCQSSAKDAPAAEVAVTKEAPASEAPKPAPAAAEQPAAEQPAAQVAPAEQEAAAQNTAAQNTAAQNTAAPAPHGAALNAPASATTAALTPKAQVGNTPATPSADAPANTETKKGAVVNEEPFSVWLEASSPLPVGAASSVDVVLVAKAPYHTNAEYPHKFKLGTAPSGLTYPEAVVKGMQVNAERSVLRVPVQAKQAGPATVAGTLSFSVCTEERCLVEKRDLSLALEAK